MAQHTPGPWVFLHGLNLFGPNDRLVANCGGHSQNFDSEACEAENAANACLISAATDLLTAAIQAANILDEYTDQGSQGVACKKLRRAIAKATNSQP